MAIDCNREHVSRIVRYRSPVAGSHGIKVGSDESLCEIANFIRIYTVRVLSGSDYETATVERRVSTTLRQVLMKFSEFFILGLST